LHLELTALDEKSQNSDSGGFDQAKIRLTNSHNAVGFSTRKTFSKRKRAARFSAQTLFVIALDLAYFLYAEFCRNLAGFF